MRARATLVAAPYRGLVAPRLAREAESARSLARAVRPLQHPLAPPDACASLNLRRDRVTRVHFSSALGELVGGLLLALGGYTAICLCVPILGLLVASLH